MNKKYTQEELDALMQRAESGFSKIREVFLRNNNLTSEKDLNPTVQELEVIEAGPEDKFSKVRSGIDSRTDLIKSSEDDDV